jgi:hypothetical protein
MQGIEVHTELWWGNLWKRVHLEEMRVDGGIMLEWIRQKLAGRAWGRYAGKRGAHRALLGKPVEKRPFGRNEGRWKDNIRKDLTEIAWEGVD